MVFAKAAREDPSSQYYMDQFAALRNIIKRNKSLAVETNPKKWKSNAKVVRDYYYSKGLYLQALELDQRALERYPDTQFTVNQLEDLLLLGQDEQATELMKNKSVPSLSDQARMPTLKLVWFAHTGRVDQALTGVESTTVDPKQTPRALLDLARVHAVAENNTMAMTCLTQFLEHTAPSELAAMRAMIGQCSEFQPLQGSDAFQKVLKTESKIPQSNCADDSQCNTCSLKGKCSSSTKGTTNP